MSGSLPVFIDGQTLYSAQLTAIETVLETALQPTSNVSSNVVIPSGGTASVTLAQLALTAQSAVQQNSNPTFANETVSGGLQVGGVISGNVSTNSGNQNLTYISNLAESAIQPNTSPTFANETVSGGLQVGGASSLTGALNVGGNSTITGALSVGGGVSGSVSTNSGNQSLTYIGNIAESAVQPGSSISTNTAIFSGAANSLTLAQMLEAFGGVPDTAFGCVGNGSTDDAPAIQAAVNWLQNNGGGKLYMRALTYLVNNSSGNPTPTSVLITGLVTIVGQGWNETCTSGTIFKTTQTIASPFYFYSPSAVVIGTITSNLFTAGTPSSGNIKIGAILSGTGILSGTVILSQVSGTTGGAGVYQVNFSQSVNSTSITASYGPSGTAGIRDCAFIQAQPSPASGWSPTNYSYCIQIQNCVARTEFDNLMFLGVNKGFYFNNSARHTQTRIYGQFFTNALYADHEYDDSFYHDWKLWPFWSLDTNVENYMQANSDAIYLGRSDGPQMGTMSILGYRSGLRVSQTSFGTVNHLFCDTWYSDACQFPVWVDNTVTQNSILSFDKIYTGGQTFSSSAIAGSTGIQIDGQCEIVVQNLYVLYCGAYGINITNNTYPSQIQIGSCTIDSWDQQAANSPAFFAAEVVTSGGVAAGVCHQIYCANPPILRNPGTTNNYQIINNTTNAILWCDGPNAQEISANFTGATVAIGARTFVYLADNSSNSAITSLTIDLPSNPVDGMEVTVVVSKPVDTITWSNASPSTAPILGAPNQLGAYQPVKFKYFGLSTSQYVSGVYVPNGFWLLSSGLNMGGYTGNFTLDGTLNLGAVPTSDPHIAGIVWRSGNTLMISTG